MSILSILPKIMTVESLKPFSQACVNNAEPIFSRIKPLLVSCDSVLEIGSGTGQHAVYFGQAMPHLQWQTSDLQENIAGIVQWLLESKQDNILPPLTFDVTQAIPTDQRYDAIYMANTLHIMSWPVVQQCIKKTVMLLNPGGLLIVYGPFNYGGHYTSESNRRFDQWLKTGSLKRGIRDFEKINVLANEASLELQQDYEMPANNRLLVWRLK